MIEADNPEADVRLARKNDKAPVDLDRLMDQWSGKSSFVAKILKAFEHETCNDMENFEGAFAGGNTTEIAGIAHRIKGAAATIGAEAIREEAAKLESMGRSGDLSQAPECFSRLKSEFERYRSFRDGMELG